MFYPRQFSSWVWCFCKWRAFHKPRLRLTWKMPRGRVEGPLGLEWMWLRDLCRWHYTVPRMSRWRCRVWHLVLWYLTRDWQSSLRNVCFTNHACIFWYVCTVDAIFRLIKIWMIQLCGGSCFRLPEHSALLFIFEWVASCWLERGLHCLQVFLVGAWTSAFVYFHCIFNASCCLQERVYTI